MLRHWNSFVNRLYRLGMILDLGNSLVEFHTSLFALDETSISHLNILLSVCKIACKKLEGNKPYPVPFHFLKQDCVVHCIKCIGKV